jgi:hypothetical protein
VFRPLLVESVIAFADDIFICSRADKHRQYVRELLQLLRQHCTLSPQNALEVHLVEFLGYMVNALGVSVEPTQKQGTKSWLVPQNVREVRFLSLASWYRRFLPDFARIAAPLTDLTKAENAPAGRPLPWGLKQQTSFKSLKQALCSAPSQAVPDSQGLFTLQIDVREFATINDRPRVAAYRYIKEACIDVS